MGAFGGAGATMSEMVLGNLVLAKGDASLGLVVAMHGALLGRVRDPASFLVPMSTPGIRIEPMWDTLGMRATGSHTVVFDNVDVGADAQVPRPVALARQPLD